MHTMAVRVKHIWSCAKRSLDSALGQPPGLDGRGASLVAAGGRVPRGVGGEAGVRRRPPRGDLADRTGVGAGDEAGRPRARPRARARGDGCRTLRYAAGFARWRRWAAHTLLRRGPKDDRW